MHQGAGSQLLHCIGSGSVPCPPAPPLQKFSAASSGDLKKLKSVNVTRGYRMLTTVMRRTPKLLGRLINSVCVACYDVLRQSTLLLVARSWGSLMPNIIKSAAQDSQSARAPNYSGLRKSTLRYCSFSAAHRP